MNRLPPTGDRRWGTRVAEVLLSLVTPSVLVPTLSTPGSRQDLKTLPNPPLTSWDLLRPSVSLAHPSVVGGSVGTLTPFLGTLSLTGLIWWRSLGSPPLPTLLPPPWLKNHVFRRFPDGKKKWKDLVSLRELYPFHWLTQSLWSVILTKGVGRTLGWLVLWSSKSTNTLRHGTTRPPLTPPTCPR